MNPTQFNSPKYVCEQILLAEERYNLEDCILPSEVAVVDRILARSLELSEGYEELHSKLHAFPGALQAFLGLVLNTAAFWSPAKIAEARAERDELAKVNRQIARQAGELARLFSFRGMC